MIGLVKRLREWVGYFIKLGDLQFAALSDDISEAADHIERLEAFVAKVAAGGIDVTRNAIIFDDGALDILQEAFALQENSHD